MPTEVSSSSNPPDLASAAPLQELVTEESLEERMEKVEAKKREEEEIAAQQRAAAAIQERKAATLDKSKRQINPSVDNSAELPTSPASLPSPFLQRASQVASDDMLSSLDNHTSTVNAAPIQHPLPLPTFTSTESVLTPPRNHEAIRPVAQHLQLDPHPSTAIFTVPCPTVVSSDSDDDDDVQESQLDPHSVTGRGAARGPRASIKPLFPGRPTGDASDPPSLATLRKERQIAADSSSSLESSFSQAPIVIDDDTKRKEDARSVDKIFRQSKKTSNLPSPAPPALTPQFEPPIPDSQSPPSRDRDETTRTPSTGLKQLASLFHPVQPQPVSSDPIDHFSSHQPTTSSKYFPSPTAVSSNGAAKSSAAPSTKSNGRSKRKLLNDNGLSTSSVSPSGSVQSGSPDVTTASTAKRARKGVSSSEVSADIAKTAFQKADRVQKERDTARVLANEAKRSNKAATAMTSGSTHDDAIELDD